MEICQHSTLILMEFITTFYSVYIVSFQKEKKDHSNVLAIAEIAKVHMVETFAWIFQFE